MENYWLLVNELKIYLEGKNVEEIMALKTFVLFSLIFSIIN